jgi:hypothetical protein
LSRGPYERSEGKLDPKSLGVPADDKRRDDRLIPTGRGAEEIDDRGLLLHRIQEPAVIGCVRISSRELVVDDIITRVDLAMSVPLIAIADPPASARRFSHKAG